MRNCEGCGAKMPWRVLIGRRMVSITKRKFCLTCSPYNNHNTRNLNKHPKDAKDKRCPDCTEVKSITAFYRRTDGRPSVYCKRCTSDQSKRRQSDLKAKAIEYKGGKCSRCGFTGPQDCFDFHHRDPKEKDFGVSAQGKCKWEKVVKELDKCDLLCANCHRIVESCSRSSARIERFATNEKAVG